MATPERTAVARWLGVGGVAFGTFSMVTVQGLPVGLLTVIGGTLDVSAGTAGLMVTLTGLVAAASALLLPSVIGRLDRRAVLIGLLFIMVAANAVTALAPNYAVLLGARLLVGVSIGGFWAIAAGLAVRLVPKHQVARATSIVFGGATIANVLGVPVGTLLGTVTDWRVAFAALGGLGLLVAAGLMLLLPSIPAAQAVNPRLLAAQLRNPRVRLGVSATGLLIGGHWAAYTFISPALQEISGVSEQAVGPVLIAFGLAAIAGNFLAGAAAGRNARATLMGISVALAAILGLFPLLGVNPVAGVALLLAWGVAFGGAPVTLQTWILQSAPGATEAASALNVTLYSLAIALGSLAGGLVVTAATVPAVLWFAAALAVLVIGVAWRLRSSPQSAAPR